MGLSKELKEELFSPWVLGLSAAWFGLGLVKYLQEGFWAYMTLPLFAVAGAWWRARRRRRGKPADDAGGQELRRS